MFPNSIVKVSTRTDDVRVDLPANVGPLGARRSKGAAERLLASFADVAEGADVVEGRVERAVDVDGKGEFYVALFEYDRAVRR